MCARSLARSPCWLALIVSNLTFHNVFFSSTDKVSRNQKCNQLHLCGTNDLMMCFVQVANICKTVGVCKGICYTVPMQTRCVNTGTVMLPRIFILPSFVNHVYKSFPISYFPLDLKQLFPRCAIEILTPQFLCRRYYFSDGSDFFCQSPRNHSVFNPCRGSTFGKIARHCIIMFWIGSSWPCPPFDHVDFEEECANKA